METKNIIRTSKIFLFICFLFSNFFLYSQRYNGSTATYQPFDFNIMYNSAYTLTQIHNIRSESLLNYYNYVYDIYNSGKIDDILIDELYPYLNSLYKLFDSSLANDNTWDKVISIQKKIDKSISNFNIRVIQYNNNITGNETGIISFYLTSNKEINSTIVLYIDGHRLDGFTTYFSNGDFPDCSGNGTISYNLSVGKHHYFAKSDNSFWEGTIIVNENKCTLQGLKYD